MFSPSLRCFCAFCRSSRIVYSKRHVSVIDILLSAIASASLSLVVWQALDPRATMFFVFSVGFAEIFVIIRSRFSMSCSRCGFDPALYRKGPELAAAKVKEHRAKRLSDPMSIFYAQPGREEKALASPRFRAPERSNPAAERSRKRRSAAPKAL